MKKGLVILMTIAMVFAMTSLAFAFQESNDSLYNTTQRGPSAIGDYATGNALNPANAPAKGNIAAEGYTLPAAGASDWNYFEQGEATSSGTYTGSEGFPGSTHKYGTWNSPYTAGIDGYNYNDAQDYIDNGAMTGTKTMKEYAINSAFEAEMTGMFTGMGIGFAPAGPLVNKDADPNAEAIMGYVKPEFTSGPHGGYLTSTHRCRECHAVHRAAGKFKLLRSDSRFEACDWCHGTGAGSGFNIQMDNNDGYTEEYNVGHTMGFGIQSGKWKAPDDTYPAFTPNYYMGGFSCFDCHSPHANPARIMGYDNNGDPIESIVDIMSGDVFNLGNPGHDMYTSGGNGFAKTDMATGKVAWVPSLGGPLPNKSKPYYLAGSWLLIKNPDKELASKTYNNVPVDVYSLVDMAGKPSYDGASIAPYTGVLAQDPPYSKIETGTEIPDDVTIDLNEFDAVKAYPINKVPTNWNTPIGSASIVDDTQMFGFGAQGVDNIMGPNNPTFDPMTGNDWSGDDYGFNIRNPFCKSLIVDEFCTDCHDGNAGLHTQAAPLFSEDRALRGQMTTGDKEGNSFAGNTTNFKGSYDIAYGHDTNVRH